jgi:hypothetical protein
LGYILRRHTIRKFPFFDPEKGILIIYHQLSENDAVFIPGDEPHIVSNPLSETSVGIDIFVPGRSFDFWRKRQTPSV